MGNNFRDDELNPIYIGYDAVKKSYSRMSRVHQAEKKAKADAAHERGTKKKGTITAQTQRTQGVEGADELDGYLYGFDKKKKKK